jgi:RHS repeat-associated protein
MKGRFVLALTVSFFLAVGSRGLLASGAAAPDVNPEGDTGALKAQIQTGGSYDIQSGNATRIVNDLHVPGALGAYGLDFTRYWNSLHPEDTNEDAEWPIDFAYSGWSHSWRWTAIYGEQTPDFEPGNTLGTWITSITIAFPDGHTDKFKIARTNGGVGTIDPRCGPPYSNPGETDWPNLAGHVHDHLVSMALDGHEFWLSRADGGSVHFVGVYSEPFVGHLRWFYQAKEVYDPNGLRTDLTYNQDGNLSQVKQEGGLYLTIHWQGLDGFALPVIGSVDSGSDYGLQSQHISYGYSSLGGGSSGIFVLTTVTYPDEPTSTAAYTYSMNYGDVPNAANQPNSFPLLKTADDPHFAGAMTKISYKYWGNSCTTHPPPNCGVACANWPRFGPETIVAERSMDRYNTVVSSFDPVCETGSRKEATGIGGWRWFYFGFHDGIYAWGYELTSETDYYQAGTYPQNPVRRRQNGSEPTTVWDGRGILTTLTYADGNPSQVHHIDGSNAFFDWVNPGNSAAPDPVRIHNQRHHWLFKKTDELGNYTVYRRDERRRVTDISYYNAAGVQVASEAYAYNQWNQVASHTLPSATVVYYQYNGLNQLEAEYFTLNGITERTEYSYDVWGRVEKVRDPRAVADNAAYTTRTEYNGRHQVIKTHYRPTAGGGPDPTVTNDYDIYGNRTAVIDELGHRKDYHYDDYRRQTSCSEQVNGPGPNGTNVTSRRTDWIYDRVLENGASFRNTAHTSKDWRIQIEPAFNAAGDRRASARTFDFNNRITSEQTGLVQHSNEAFGTLHTVDGVTGIQRFSYDENGQKQTSTDPLGRVTTFGYNNRNRLETTTEPKRTSQPANPMTRVDYDAAGNKRQVTFPDNTTQQWDLYDPFGQAWKFTDERHNVTDLVYTLGPMKKLQTVKTYRQRDNPPGGTETQETSFQYDGMGRAKKTLFPDSSTEETTSRLGQVETYKTRRDQTKHIHYDARGREDSHSWDYGAAPRIDRVWDDAGRLTRISNVFSTIDYTYDNAGQVIIEGSTVAGSGMGGNGALRQVIYWRYPHGEVAQITYPNGAIVTRNYTARGQLKSVDWSGGSTSYAYLPDGKVDYQAWSNNLWTKFEYDGRGLIGSVLHRNTQQGQDLAKREYWRNDRDQILAWKRGGVPGGGGPNGMEDGRGNRYAYDEEGQLTSASYRVQDPAGAATGAMRADVFEYDKMGNRMGTHNIASRGSTNFARDNNGLNQYSSWTPSAINQDDDMGGQWGSPGHANGVTMQEGYITASFNALNQPIAMWSPVYNPNFLWFGYDPLGRCVKRWTGSSNGTPVGSTTYYYYDGQNLVQEGSSAMFATRIYLHGTGVDQIVASQVSSGEWRYHHYDGQGNCILLTNTSGGISEQYDYDAFGMPYVYNAGGATLAAAAQWGNRFLFTGREWLSDLRIYDYRARQYQPELGRFLQPDPKEFAAGDYNLYRYCHNDPVNKSDPSGLQDWEQKTSFSKDGKCEKVTWTSTVTLRPPLGSNIPVVLHIEVNRTQVNVDHLAQKDGTKAAGLTTADSQTSRNSVQWSILVRYNTGEYGRAWQKFTRDKEPEHADAILKRAQSDATQISFAQGVLHGDLESRAKNILADQVAYEEFLDKLTGRHTLKDAHGNPEPDEK